LVLENFRFILEDTATSTDKKKRNKADLLYASNNPENSLPPTSTPTLVVTPTIITTPTPTPSLFPFSAISDINSKNDKNLEYVDVYIRNNNLQNNSEISNNNKSHNIKQKNKISFKTQMAVPWNDR
jgi:hypothetical protein